MIWHGFLFGIGFTIGVTAAIWLPFLLLIGILGGVRL
jgi:hypothetical protein